MKRIFPHALACFSAVVTAATGVACSESDSTGSPATGGASSGGSGGAAGGAGASGGSAGATGGSAGSDAGSTCAGGSSVVGFATDDGVNLAADFHSSSVKGGRAAILLHMIPPSNNRTNYKPSFISALTAKGIHVLNVDRRGAGDSQGVATEAYQGPNGKLDAKAAVDFLLQHECAIDKTRIALVGASNGTTTALDFTVFAGADAAYETPKALVFLTGGAYTENQNTISSHRPLLDPLSMHFVYSKAESAWSKGFEAGAPSTWKFSEYDPGDHGTVMFDVRPESIAEVANFLDGAL